LRSGQAGRRLFTLRPPAVDAEWALVEQLAGPGWRLIVTGEKDGKATAERA